MGDQKFYIGDLSKGNGCFVDYPTFVQHQLLGDVYNAVLRIEALLRQQSGDRTNASGDSTSD